MAATGARVTREAAVPAPAATGPALVLVGFMGAGKSTAARAAAEALGTEALDADALLEAELGTSIAAFFARHGEGAFREREGALVRRLLARARPGDVVALGGGALGAPGVAQALAGHTVVLLEVDEETAWARAAGAQRPLAQDRAAFARLLAERTPAYERAAHAILPASDPAAVRAALPHLRALADQPPGTRLLWAQAASGAHPVLVGRGLLPGVAWPVDGRRFLVTDEAVGALHARALGPVAGDLRIPPGEAHKTLATATRLWTALAEQGATRADHLVALGGGVVGDLAGFVAATYQRGIPVVQVPTTLLAQVDSAYGGKTGVDLPQAKNYVGAYHQPAAVLVDPALLDTLPPAERAAGQAEVVKTALLAGGALWERVRAGGPADEEVILGCARTKLRIVAADERDAGARQALNLGHTVGHALETVTGYRALRHGEAVGLGLLAALRLSGAGALRDEVAALLAVHGLPTRLPPGVDPDEVVAATARDKKRLRGPTPFVLLPAPGRVEVGQPVGRSELRAAVAELA